MKDMKTLSNEAKANYKELKKSIKKYEKKVQPIQQFLKDDILYFLCHVGVYNGEFVSTGKFTDRRVAYVFEKTMKETVDEMEIARAIGLANSDKRNNQKPAMPALLDAIEDVDMAQRYNLVQMFCRAIISLATFAFELEAKKTSDTKAFLNEYYKMIENKFNINCNNLF